MVTSALACPLLSQISSLEVNVYLVYSTYVLLMQLGFLSPEADPNPNISSSDGENSSNNAHTP